MGFTERQDLYKKIEKNRGKPLIAYVTSIRPNLTANMAGDAVLEIINQIREIPSEVKEIDFLIISNGGDPITSLRIISILRERFEKISVLIPFVAYSAATILALGADEIVMHPFSNLGPVDPQLTASKGNGTGQSSSIQFSSEDIRNYIDFVKSDVGITDQAHLMAAFTSLTNEVGPLPIGSAKRGQQLSLTLSIKMLETHMHDKNKAGTIAKALNSSYYHHGYAVGRKEASEIGLCISTPCDELENLMWEVWEDFKCEMKCDKAFEIISELMNDPVAYQAISNISIVNIPANTPPEIAQNIIIQVAQKTKVTSQQAIEISPLLASIESKSVAYSIRNYFNIVFWRNAEMALSINTTSYSKGWEKT